MKTPFRYNVWDSEKMVINPQAVPLSENVVELVQFLFRSDFLQRDVESRREGSFIERASFVWDVIIDHRHFVAIQEHGGGTRVEEIVVEEVHYEPHEDLA